MKPSLFSGVVASLLVLAATLPADAKLATQGKSAVEFVARGPAGMKIVGKSNELQLTDTDSAVQVTVPLAKLDTDIELRNKHMRQYLKTDKHPNAVLVVEKSAVGYPNVKSGKATGKLTIKGETKPVTFEYTATKKGDVYTVSASFRIDIKDFGIEQPGYLGVTVRREVDVSVEFNAVDR